MVSFASGQAALEEKKARGENGWRRFILFSVIKPKDPKAERERKKYKAALKAEDLDKKLQKKSIHLQMHFYNTF